MPVIQYQQTRFSPWKLTMIKRVNEIVTRYSKMGYDLTLRQVYYQFVARDLLPETWADPKTGSTNNEKSYKKLGDIISDARMAGLLDWYAIVDRTRSMYSVPHWNDPEHAIGDLAERYRLDKWSESDQPYRIQVWVEKDALEGVVGRTCSRLDVPYFSCRGYTSQTAMWENAQAMKELAKDDVVPVILHLGDHDPSGIDMSRDIEDRVRMFMDDYGETLIFKRLALNMDQVEKYNPPENPAKSTDSRFKKYVELHGDRSWELDALDPTVIDKLISDAIAPYRNDKLYSVPATREADERELLLEASNNWEVIADRLENPHDDED